MMLVESCASIIPHRTIPSGVHVCVCVNGCLCFTHGHGKGCVYVDMLFFLELEFVVRASLSSSTSV